MASQPSQNEFVEFLWKGQVRYRCPDCGFDSYECALVRKHWQEVHRVEEPAGPVLFDADDKPIEKEIYVPGNR